MAKRQAILGLLCVFALAISSSATTKRPTDAKCPVCENTFQGPSWASTNSFGGVDRDFLAQAVGEQTLLLNCWTCPKCWFTGYPDAFDDAPPSAKTIEKIKAGALKPAAEIDPKLKDTEEIEAWVRYDLLAQVLLLEPEPPLETIAFAYLRAGQTQRFDGGPLFGRARELADEVGEGLDADKRGYELAMDLGRALEKLGADAERAAPDRAEAQLAAAVVYRSRGEVPAVERIVASLRKATLTDEMKRAVDHLAARNEREKSYVARAIPYFERVVATDDEKTDPEERFGRRYLLGELLRKVGKLDDAQRRLESVAKEEDADEGLRKWAREAAERVRAARPK